MSYQTNKHLEALAGSPFELFIEGGWPNVPGHPELANDQYLRGFLGGFRQNAGERALELVELKVYDSKTKNWRKRPEPQMFLPIAEGASYLSRHKGNLIATINVPGMYHLDVYRCGSRLSHKPRKHEDLLSRLRRTLSHTKNKNPTD